MDVVIDDHLLLKILLNDEPPELRPPGARVFTTGLWYHRLCRAVATRAVTGALTRSLGQAEPVVAISAVKAITALPDTIGLVSFRDLAWTMARLLDGGTRLNLMSLEALAAARHLDAEICLAAIDENPLLLAAAADYRTPTRLLD
ncbi:MAG: hypothetical protein M3063_11495 [Actinomycetota bacterium]|nr:hypothetical protein [Actinomycetota bacterium]